MPHFRSQGNSHSERANNLTQGHPDGYVKKTETYTLNFRLSHSEILPAASLGRIMSKIISFPKNPNSTVTVGFPGGSISKEFTCNAEDLSLIPGLGRSPGEENDNLLQCSCLGNPMDRGAWWPTVHGVVRVRHHLAAKPPPLLPRISLWRP